MKAESFFIGPYDEDLKVDLSMSLSDLKFVHGILVDCYNQGLVDGSATKQLEKLVINLNTVITSKLVAEEKKV